jgi:hypothetical protein
MKEEEIEKLLRVMPLKAPAKMPKALLAGAKPESRLLGWLQAALSFRIPLWQAALAVALAVVIYAGAAALISHPPEPREPHIQVAEVTPTDKHPSSPGEAPILSTEGFWQLPPRYRPMIEAARKLRPDWRTPWRAEP